MDWSKRIGWILDEGLLIEDALDLDRGVATGVAIDVGLIPAEAKAGEGSGIQRRILNQEHIEAGAFWQAAGCQSHDIVLLAVRKSVGDFDSRLRVLDGRAGEGTGEQARI